MRRIYVGNGINQYPGIDNGASNLTKCVEDVRNISNTLKKIGFEIYTYFDTQCTKSEIIRHWKNSIALVKPEEIAIIVWHNSSHGSQVPCATANEEEDGMDECICCHDVKWNSGLNKFDNVITDDEINELLKQVPENITIELVCDSCNSGDMMRGLKPVIITNRRFLYPRNNKVGKIVKSIGSGFIEKKNSRHILLAGTSPNLYSYEVGSGGVLSSSIVKAIESALPKLPSRTTAIKFILDRTADLGYGNLQYPHYECDNKMMDFCIFSLDANNVGTVSKGVFSWFKKLFSFLF